MPPTKVKTPPTRKTPDGRIIPDAPKHYIPR